MKISKGRFHTFVHCTQFQFKAFWNQVCKLQFTVHRYKKVTNSFVTNMICKRTFINHTKHSAILIHTSVNPAKYFTMISILYEQVFFFFFFKGMSSLLKTGIQVVKEVRSLLKVLEQSSWASCVIPPSQM